MRDPHLALVLVEPVMQQVGEKIALIVGGSSAQLWPTDIKVLEALGKRLPRLRPRKAQFTESDCRRIRSWGTERLWTGFQVT
jgi:hypothetical protein